MIKRSAILLLIMMLVSGWLLLFTAGTAAPEPARPSCRHPSGQPLRPLIRWNLVIYACFPAET